MAITTIDQYFAAAKQRAILKKTTTRTTVANTWYSMFDIAGNPGAGTLAIGNTANGVVPTDAVAGYPVINAFGGGATGYLGRVSYSSTVACRIALYDRVFAAGAYAFNANTNLTAQPSYLGRIAGGTAADCAGQTELWVEQVTASTGNQSVAVAYTNEAGTAGRSTGAVGVGGTTAVGRCWQLPLQAGDKGVSLISNVTGTVATAGTFNVMVLRPLGDARIVAANFQQLVDFLAGGSPTLFADSSLYMLINTDSTSSGLPDLTIDIVNG